ncbi:MAG TPA: hypothetical protein VFX96_16705 [Pyrinomonadaceae bacterium]|nr:hypothetical protein [Pyrinomonadaceae bacterium]
MPESDDEMTLRVLRLFGEWGREVLDLHELFEAGDSNDPEARREVFFTVERLVEEGLLEERGNDFYALTDAGRKTAGREAGDGRTER